MGRRAVVAGFLVGLVGTVVLSLGLGIALLGFVGIPAGAGVGLLLGIPVGGIAALICWFTAGWLARRSADRTLIVRAYVLEGVVIGPLLTALYFGLFGGSTDSDAVWLAIVGIAVAAGLVAGIGGLIIGKQVAGVADPGGGATPGATA